MWKRAALSLFLLPVLFAQTDRTVTVTASRNSNVAPDQAVFSINVYSPTTASRDDVLAALPGSGLAAANLTSVYTTTQLIGKTQQDVLHWTFQLTAPLSDLKSTVAKLTGLQQAVAQQKNGMSVDFAVRGTQTSAQALANQPCSTADLISDARTKAQKMAAAAGAGVGAIVAVTATSVVTPPSDTLFASALSQPSCSITVKFALTGF